MEGTLPCYKTKQRELIWNYLCAHAERHVLAEDIEQHLRMMGNAVGKSTVYRYLDKLVSEGVVRKFFLEEGMSACYQLITPGCREHFHLKCTLCGKLFHIECGYLADVQAHILETHHFHMDNTKTVLYGICESCNKEVGEKE